MHFFFLGFCLTGPIIPEIIPGPHRSSNEPLGIAGHFYRMDGLPVNSTTAVMVKSQSKS